MSTEVDQLIRRWEIEDLGVRYWPLKPLAGRLSPEEVRRYSEQTAGVVLARRQEVRRRFGSSPDEWREALTQIRRLAVMAYRRIGKEVAVDWWGEELAKLGVAVKRPPSESSDDARSLALEYEEKTLRCLDEELATAPEPVVARVGPGPLEAKRPPVLDSDASGQERVLQVRDDAGCWVFVLEGQEYTTTGAYKLFSYLSILCSTPSREYTATEMRQAIGDKPAKDATTDVRTVRKAWNTGIEHVPKAVRSYVQQHVEIGATRCVYTP